MLPSCQESADGRMPYSVRASAIKFPLQQFHSTRAVRVEPCPPSASALASRFRYKWVVNDRWAEKADLEHLRLFRNMNPVFQPDLCPKCLIQHRLTPSEVKKGGNNLLTREACPTSFLLLPRQRAFQELTQAAK